MSLHQVWHLWCIGLLHLSPPIPSQQYSENPKSLIFFWFRALNSNSNNQLHTVGSCHRFFDHNSSVINAWSSSWSPVKYATPPSSSSSSSYIAGRSSSCMPCFATSETGTFFHQFSRKRLSPTHPALCEEKKHIKTHNPARKAKLETTPFSTVHNAADSELETSSSSSSSNKKIGLREPHEKRAPAINRTMWRNKHPDEDKRRNTLLLLLLPFVLHHVKGVGGDQSAKP